VGLKRSVLLMLSWTLIRILFLRARFISSS